MRKRAGGSVWASNRRTTSLAPHGYTRLEQAKAPTGIDLGGGMATERR